MLDSKKKQMKLEKKKKKIKFQMYIILVEFLAEERQKHQLLAQRKHQC